MEPTSAPPESKPKGRKGSLENPEVYENVPGHIIPILEQEFDDFDTEAGKFLRDTAPPPAPPDPQPSPWLRTARLEAVEREPSREPW